MCPGGAACGLPARFVLFENLNLTGRFPGIGVVADRLVFRELPGIVDRRLLQRVLDGIVLRLLTLRDVDRLAGVAVAAGVVGVYGGAGFGIGVEQGGHLRLGEVSKDRAGYIVGV
jgi:hypothetical protein